MTTNLLQRSKQRRKALFAHLQVDFPPQVVQSRGLGWFRRLGVLREDFKLLVLIVASVLDFLEQQANR